MIVVEAKPFPLGHHTPKGQADVVEEIWEAMLRNREARCMANPGHNQRWMYSYSIMAGGNILLDITCSKCLIILRRETVQYAGKVNRRWLGQRKIDRRCLQRRADYGASGSRATPVATPHRVALQSTPEQKRQRGRK